MKKIFIVLIFSLISCVMFAQGIVEELNNYNKEKDKSIIFNNLLDSSTFSLCNFNEKISIDSIDFVIVPSCDFSTKIDNYDSCNTLLNFIKINKNLIKSFIIYNNSFIGILSCFKDTSYVKGGYYFDEISKKLVAKKKCDTCFWHYSILLVCQDLSNYYSAFQFIKENNIDLFFTINDPHFWTIWYIENNELMVYDIREQKSYKEREYLKGVKIIEKDGKTYYLFEYNE